jgi:uncharacterized membrane protein
MTEFYILGKEGLAEDYPREATVGEELSVTMGVSNLERQSKTYNVEVWAVDPWEDRRELVATAGPFTLDREASVEQAVTWAMPWEGDDQIVEFYLYTTDQEERDPYRALRLWLNVLEDQPLLEQGAPGASGVPPETNSGETRSNHVVVPYGDGP